MNIRLDQNRNPEVVSLADAMSQQMQQEYKVRLDQMFEELGLNQERCFCIDAMARELSEETMRISKQASAYFMFAPIEFTIMIGEVNHEST